MGFRQRIFSRLRRIHKTDSEWSLASTPGPRVDISEYVLADPTLVTLSDGDLRPPLRTALQSGDPEQLRALLRVVHPDIYAISIFSQQWCHRVLNELDALDKWVEESGCRVETPNSMNNYGVILSQIGLTPMVDALLEDVMGPISALCFPEVGGDTLNDVHGFVVEYQPNKDRSLGFHVDDSEVTLNLCLGTQFTGGDLYFEGRRCEMHRQTGCSDVDRFVWEHQVGVGVIHAGKHRHGALPISEGVRKNLILWCRSETHRIGLADEADCPEWCSESMRR